MSTTTQTIIGYRALAQALNGWRSPESLRFYDLRGRLPVTKQWHEGQRAFDPAEVEALRLTLANNDFKLPRRQTS